MAIGDYDNDGFNDLAFTEPLDGKVTVCYGHPPEAVLATIDVDPDTLNLRSNGEWITAYITLPLGYGMTDIDSDTVKLDSIQADWSEIQSDVFMAKFDRELVQTLLTGLPDYVGGTKFQELTL